MYNNIILQADQDFQNDLESASWVFLLTLSGVLVVVAAYVLRYVSSKLKGSFRVGESVSPRVENTSILMARFTDGSSMTQMGEWTQGGMNVKSFAVVNYFRSSAGMSAESIMLQVQMPFRTKIHLLGIPKESSTPGLKLEDDFGVMEEVVLEGDYPNYFTLYADKNQQVDVRYHLDPSAMEFTVDFCRSHFWEVVEDKLYFLQSRGQFSSDDPTHMTDDVEQFVESIRPSVELQNTPQQDQQGAAYGDETRSSLACPVCRSSMPNQAGYFSCPDGHGVLISGANLKKLRGKGEQVKFIDSKDVDHTVHDIDCPSCGSVMHKVNYSGGNTIIDSCTNCAYRWLDHGEVQTSVKV